MSWQDSDRAAGGLAAAALTGGTATWGVNRLPRGHRPSREGNDSCPGNGCWASISAPRTRQLHISTSPPVRSPPYR
ncbi:hypothetical protein RHCRD62_10529 [Rhodococcus sp. RD6.2]|nr:hypothetical protein RHCRD62_10529 [Rhodococcus sp. RD6.2]